MSASFYDLLKYAKTGIASPDMTGYDKLRALAMAGGGKKTLTGTPPIDFFSKKVQTLTWTVIGNMRQDGTPSPQSIVTPSETGDPTGQLIPYPFYSADGEYSGVQFTTDNGRITASGTLTSGLLYYLWRPSKFPAGTYTLSVKGKHSGATIYFRDATHRETIAYIAASLVGDRSVTFTLTEEISAMVYANASSGTIDYDCTIMLNAGDTVLPYAPNPYVLPLTLGQTQNVYLQEPLRRIGDYADTVSSDGTVTRRIKKLVLTGTEQWGFISPTYWSNLPGSIAFSEILCTHYNSNKYSYSELFSCSTNRGQGLSIWINDDRFNGISNDFKAWIAQQYAAGTPVCVWYVLETPTTETITAPTLTTAKGSNTLTVDTTLQPSAVSITGNIKAT